MKKQLFFLRKQKFSLDFFYFWHNLSCPLEHITLTCTSTIGTFFNLKLPLPDEAFEDPALVPGPVKVAGPVN
jgi:hypothetical protein